jgi:tRNA threonylcarbamoyladenosine modification (KEOPS) complex  Pcc1 subunit
MDFKAFNRLAHTYSSSQLVFISHDCSGLKSNVSSFFGSAALVRRTTHEENNSAEKINWDTQILSFHGVEVEVELENRRQESAETVQNNVLEELNKATRRNRFD